MDHTVIKTPETNIVNSFMGKRCLFLENDTSLNNGLEEFQRILDTCGIEYKILFNLSDLLLEDIKKNIDHYDVIIFMTQWVTDISFELKKYIYLLSSQGIKKDIVEVFIDKPTWRFKPKDIIHDIYVYSCMMWFKEADKDTEEFYKLSNVPYWDYKNKFDL